ncbi:unnamed protein product [Calypogeia fissa]
MSKAYRNGSLHSWFWGMFIVSFLATRSLVSSLSSDGNALLSLKASLNDSAGSHLSSWIETDATPCNWTGITCSADLLVIGLILPDLNLSGTMSDQIGQIVTLQNISLGSNNISGPIPPSIFHLSELQYLDLHGNYLTGPIPSGFQSLINLEYLNLNSNFLVGGIPEDFANQTAVWYLDVSGNNALGGRIPPGIGSLSNLRWLDMDTCGLVGELPPELGNLTQLQTLYLQVNYLEGPIPASFGALDSLETLDLSYNQLTTLPGELGNLRSIQLIRLLMNAISGPIPPELGQLNKTLVNLDLANNHLSGTIPEEIGSLSLLILLHLSDNNLTGTVPAGIAEMTFLEDVFLYDNFLTGELPPNLGRNQPLRKLDTFNNSFTGFIPGDLCNQGQLERLILSSNWFSGEIPDTLGSCPSLFRLRLDNNELNGTIPLSLGNSTSLNYTDLSYNQLTGSIPAELGSCTSLGYLSLTGNQLTGNLPVQLGNLVSLTHFEAAYNNLTGNIPVELCSTRISFLDLSFNELSGQVPFDISTCQDLTQLILNDNHLSGIIPPTFANMPSLGELYLAHNDLGGPIPPELAASHLEKLDVSFNNLTGPVTRMGFFGSLNVSDYQGNPDLCAAVPELQTTLKPCIFQDDWPQVAQSSNDKGTGLILIFCILAGILLPLLSFVTLCSCYFFCRSERFRKFRAQQYGVGNSWTMTMFQAVPDLTLEDILRALDEDNVVGSGGSGKVYRGEIPAGKMFRGRTRTEDQSFVVKKLNRCNTGEGTVLDDDHGFRAEVETLGNIRHSNIVKLLACCADDDTKLLVYEYMPNGSLADQLHGPKGGMLDWETRLQIALGAAQGLSYLHHDCVPPILHRDVKSTNILLDEDFNARLADFGLAKLLQDNRQLHTMSDVVGSHGYIAPELAYSMKANKKSDVYSYGVVLLELATGRRAVEGDNHGDLVTWTQWRIREKQGLLNSLDKRLGHIPDETQEEMMMVLRIGLFCTNASPAHRPCMRDVVRMLVDVKISSNIPMGYETKTRAAKSQLLPTLL